MANNPVDQDALAAEWGLALEDDSGAIPKPKAAAPADDSDLSADDVASQWAAYHRQSGSAPADAASALR